MIKTAYTWSKAIQVNKQTKNAWMIVVCEVPYKKNVHLYAVHKFASSF